MELLHHELSDQILKAFYTVYNELQYGFVEKIYENALCYELRALGLKVEWQKRIEVYYKEMLMGEYVTDLIVEDKILIENKSQANINEAHEAQLLHYLRATRYEVGLLLNFGPKPQFRRKVFANTRKKLPA